MGQISIWEKIRKSSQNSPILVLIFRGSVLCLCIICYLKFMTLMDFQKSLGMWVGGVSDIQFFVFFLNVAKPLIVTTYLIIIKMYQTDRII